MSQNSCILILGDGIDWLKGQKSKSLFVVSDPPLHLGFGPIQAIYDASELYIIMGGESLLKGEMKDRKIPGEKAVETYFEVLSDFSQRTVVDPFMGTGTTGEAALRAGHAFVGIEIDTERFTMASKRLEKWK